MSQSRASLPGLPSSPKRARTCTGRGTGSIHPSSSTTPVCGALGISWAGRWRSSKPSWHLNGASHPLIACPHIKRHCSGGRRYTRHVYYFHIFCFYIHSWSDCLCLYASGCLSSTPPFWHITNFLPCPFATPSILDSQRSIIDPNRQSTRSPWSIQCVKSQVGQPGLEGGNEGVRWTEGFL